MQEEMNSVAPYPEAAAEQQKTQQVQLPSYDSLPAPPYAFHSIPPRPPPGYGEYYLQPYAPSPGYDEAFATSRHIYPPGPCCYPNQSQPGFVMMGGLPPIQYKAVQTFYGHFALACIVAWICNPLFGIISIILAFLAQNAATSGKDEESRRLGQASLGISLAGILVMIILAIIFVAIAMVA